MHTFCRKRQKSERGSKNETISVSTYPFAKFRFFTKQSYISHGEASVQAPTDTLALHGVDTARGAIQQHIHQLVVQQVALAIQSVATISTGLLFIVISSYQNKPPHRCRESHDSHGLRFQAQRPLKKIPKEKAKMPSINEIKQRIYCPN